MKLKKALALVLSLMLALSLVTPALAYNDDTVAIIDVAEYTSLDDAVTAASSGKTIVLQKDVTFGTDRSVPVWEKEFNLDLGGHTFTTNSEEGITQGNNGYKASAICFGDSAIANPHRDISISNGTINTAYGAGVYASDDVAVTLSGLTIDAGKTGTQSTPEYSSAVRLTCEAHVTIISGSYKGSGYAIAVSNSGGIVTINGGTFTGDIFFSASTDSGKTKSITINGGTFTGNFVNADKGTLVITGGTFSSDPSAYVADGYTVFTSGGKYVVANADAAAVAQIGATKYLTLVDAITAANASGNCTITIQKDIDFSQSPYDAYKWAGSTYNPLEITASGVTIDLNGHRLYKMGNCALVFGHILAKDGRISSGTIRNGSLQAGTTDGITNSYVLGVAGVDGMTISNVTTNGGLNVCTGSTNVTIDNCTVNGTKYYALCAQSGSGVTVTNSAFTKNTDTSVATKAMFWVQSAGTDSDCETDSNPTGAFDESSITLASGTYTVDSANGGVFYLSSGLTPVVSGGTFSTDPTAFVDTAAYAVTDNSNGTWTVMPNGNVTKIGTTGYPTLQAALDAAVAASKTANGDEVTVTLLADVTNGTGLATFDTTKTARVVIDFGNHTYTIVEPPVGSSGTAYQALHFEAKAVTLKNGKIEMTDNETKLTDYHMLLQNYCNLTIQNMTIDGTGITEAFYNSDYYQQHYPTWFNTAKPQFNFNTTGTTSVIRNSTITVVGDFGIDDNAALTIEDDAIISAKKIVTKGTDNRYASANPTITVENGAKLKLANTTGLFENVLTTQKLSDTADANGFYTVEEVPAEPVEGLYASAAALADTFAQDYYNQYTNGATPAVADNEFYVKAVDGNLSATQITLIPTGGTTADAAVYNAADTFQLSIGNNAFVTGNYFKIVDGDLYLAFPVVLFEMYKGATVSVAGNNYVFTGGADAVAAIDAVRPQKTSGSAITVTDQAPRYILEHQQSANATEWVELKIHDLAADQLMITKKVNTTPDNVTTTSYGMTKPDVSAHDAANVLAFYAFGYNASAAPIAKNGTTIAYQAYLVGVGKTAQATLELKCEPFATDDANYSTMDEALTGVTDSTEITVYTDTTIGGTDVAAGSTVTVTETGSAAEAGAGDNATTVTPKTLTIDADGDQTVTTAYVVAQSTKQCVVTADKDATITNVATAEQLVKVGEVLATAVAANTGNGSVDAEAITKVSIGVDTTTKYAYDQNSDGKITYTAKACATLVQEDMDDKKIELSNSDLATDAVFTFKLDVPNDMFAAAHLNEADGKRYVEVKHIGSGGYSDEICRLEIKGTEDCYYVECTVTHFSDFELAPVTVATTAVAAVGASISLEDSIKINFYVSGLSDEPAKYSVRYTYKGVTSNPIALSNIEPYSAGVYKIVAADCAAKEMTETVDFEVLYDGVVIVLVENYSIYSYCTSMIDKSSDAELVALCKSVLDYGGAAQTYFGYPGQGLANSYDGATEELTIMNTDIPSSFAHAKTPGDNVHSMSASLNLKSRTELNFYIDTTTPISVAPTVTVAGKAWGNIEFVSAPTNPGAAYTYRVTVKGLQSAKLGQVTVLSVQPDEAVSATTLTYSPITYAYRNQNGSDNLKMVCKTLYRYYTAAAEYFG